MNIDDLKKNLETLKESVSDYMNLAYLFAKSDPTLIQKISDQCLSFNAQVGGYKTNLIKLNFVENGD